MTQVKVTYWEKWGGKEEETMIDIVHSFNSSQDQYEVVMESTGTWSSSPDLPRFLRAQQKGTSPDLIGLEGHQISDLAVQGALLPLTTFIDSTEISSAGYHERFLDQGVYKDRVYGVPISADIATLYVNLHSVRGTRIEEGQIPSDLHEFEVALHEIESKGTRAFVPTYPGWWPHIWPLFFGGRWFDEKERFVPDSSANIRAYEWASSFRREDELEVFTEIVNPIGAEGPDPFLAGKVAMVFEGDWLVHRLISCPDLDWAPAPFPTIDNRPAAFVEADLVGIPEGAQYPEGAAEFIRFVMQRSQIEHLAIGHGKISPLVHWSERFLSTHSNPQLQALQEILRSTEIFHDPHVPGWITYRDRIKTAFNRIWSEKESPFRALSEIREDRYNGCSMWRVSE